MNSGITIRFLGPTLCLGLFGICASTQNSVHAPQTEPISWTDVLKQKSEWYCSPEAVRIADNVLLYHRDTGGWPKNIDMAKVLTELEVASIIKQKQKIDSNIDNGSTYTQLTFLARVYQAKKLERHKEAFLKGLDYLLKAQYDNGGWPQYFPNSKGYYAHITFNDGAMIGVMKLLRDITQKKAAYIFVDDSRRSKASHAVEKGIELILKSQVMVKGQRTVWGAQHDEATLAPAPARTFEPVSLASAESLGIVRFLLGLKNPDARVIKAVESAVVWFKQAEIMGVRWEEQRDPSSAGGLKRAAVQDPNAGALWARFYEIGTNRPVFAGRDGVVKYSVAEIEEERRNGYGWYVTSPTELLEHDYPAWKKRLAQPD